MDSLFFRCLVAAATGYLLGNLNGAVILSNLTDHQDVRNLGSGNAGMTNFLRNFGLRKTVPVVVTDLSKTLLACLCGGLLLQDAGYYPEGVILGGVAVTLGHDFPAVMGFRGGKGILCAFGLILILDWQMALVALALFSLIVLISRYVSLGSCLTVLLVATATAARNWHRPWVVAGICLVTVLALWMHRGNICRIFRGTERKISLRKGAHS